MAIRSTLFVTGDADAIAANILQSQGLFRAGFALDPVMLVSDVALAVVLVHLLRAVSATLSLMAAAFRLAQAAALAFNLLNHHVPMLLLGNVGTVSGHSATKVNALVLLFLEMHAHSYDPGLIPFGFPTWCSGISSSARRVCRAFSASGCRLRVSSAGREA